MLNTPNAAREIQLHAPASAALAATKDSSGYSRVLFSDRLNPRVGFKETRLSTDSHSITQGARRTQNMVTGNSVHAAQKPRLGTENPVTIFSISMHAA
jgi:hypothetical protein